MLYWGKLKFQTTQIWIKILSKWVSMEEKLENPDQMIDFQTEYTKELHDLCLIIQKLILN